MPRHPLEKLFASIDKETKAINRDVKTRGLIGCFWGPAVNRNQDRLDRQRSRMKNLERHIGFRLFQGSHRKEVKRVKNRISNSQRWIDGTRNVNTALSNVRVNVGFSAFLHGTVSLPLALPAQTRKALPPSKRN